MQLVNNASVKQKVAFGFGLIMLLSLIFAVGMFTTLLTLKSGANQLAEGNPKVSLSKSAQLNIVNMWQYLTDASLTQEQEALNEAALNLQEAKENIDRLIVLYDNGQVAGLKKLRDEAEDAYKSGVRMFEAYGVSKEDGDLAMEEFDSKNARLIEDIYKLAAETEKQSEEKTSSLMSVLSGAIWSVGLFSVLSLILCSVVVYRIVGWIKSELSKLNDAAQLVAQGKTDIILEVSSKDEFGKLAEVFNMMVEKIERQIKYLEYLPTPVMTIDKEFNVTYMNKKGAEAVGKTQEECLKAKCYDLFKTDHCKTKECRLYQAMEEREVRTGETIARPNNKELSIMYTGAPTIDRNGNIIGALEYVTDISEIKGIQKYLERSTNRLLEGMNRFASGDLTVRLESERKGDDIARLIDGFNDVVERIRDMILKLKETIRATVDSSNQISSSTEELAAGAQEQSSQVSEIATAINQMAATIIQT
ncbi:MAG: HAMP domain-containing protein [Melioribacter sp.]|uniref:HAMP domain-containing protein n=1 Tax=Melioribacter sp. TaxID=2052167 RepID=UPI003BE27220